MRLFEMEPKIDKLGLKKLEVRLQRGGRVHWFICSNHGKLVVFDTNGLAFVPIYRLDFDSEAISKIAIDEITIIHKSKRSEKNKTKRIYLTFV